MGLPRRKSLPPDWRLLQRKALRWLLRMALRWPKLSQPGSKPLLLSLPGSHSALPELLSLILKRPGSRSALLLDCPSYLCRAAAAELSQDLRHLPAALASRRG